MKLFRQAKLDPERLNCYVVVVIWYDDFYKECNRTPFQFALIEEVEGFIELFGDDATVSQVMAENQMTGTFQSLEVTERTVFGDVYRLSADGSLGPPETNVAEETVAVTDLGRESWDNFDYIA